MRKASGCTSSRKTKGSAFLDDLRNVERAKVECGKAHFRALESDESPREIQGGEYSG